MLDGTPLQMLDSMNEGRVLCLSMSNTCPPLSSCIFDPDIFPADIFDADLVQVQARAKQKPCARALTRGSGAHNTSTAAQALLRALMCKHSSMCSSVPRQAMPFSMPGI